MATSTFERLETLHSTTLRYIYCITEEKFWFQKIHSSLTVFIAFPQWKALHCIQHQQPSLLLAKDRIYALCVIAWFCQKPVTVVASPPSITSPNLHVYNSAGNLKLFYLYYSYNACIILGNIVLCDGFWLTIFIHALQPELFKALGNVCEKSDAGGQIGHPTIFN